MIKNPLPYTLIILIALSINIYSQDFNLLNPSNEMYLFSAYDEGANAFRYNPAVLGLGHRLNATINAFIENYNGKAFLNEIGASVNSGQLGLAYVNNTISAPVFGHNTVYNHYSLGFGNGNKTFSYGILMEYITNTVYTIPSFFDVEKSRFRLGFGVLFRPFKYLSTSFVFKNNNSVSKDTPLNNSYMFGAAFRPTGNDILTIMSDFVIMPYANLSVFSTYSFKIGFDVKPYKSLHINANYMFAKFQTPEYNYINIGFGFELPHGEIQYNNTLYKQNYVITNRNPLNGTFNSDYYPDAKYKTQGHNFSVSYSAEKHESIIPERKKVLELTLSGTLQDYTTEDVFFGMLGKAKRSVHEVIADIDYAASDPSVKGILLRIYPLSTGRLEINAQMEELTNAMERFKVRNKKITAYIVQDCGPAEYYIATFADDIVLPPEALLFYGLSINVFNYKQFLEKYGIELQNFYAGKYKLTFQGILDSSTAEGKEVIERILDVVYDKMMKRLISVRNISMDDYMKTKISEPMTGPDALRLGLVDKLGWYEDAKKISEDATKTSNVVKNLNRSIWDNGWSEPEEIAIIGVYASMTVGESQSPPPITLPIPYLGGGRSTGSESVVRQLEDAFSNPKVKAVILRIDSGGGSVLASAEINSAIIRLKKKYKKRFYVSMGGSAASGGYYVSSNADKIFCDELTVTGSIGVFTTRPNADSLLRQQKLKVENFKRGDNSDITTYYRELTQTEKEIIQGIIDYYYERFIDAISEGRKLSREEVEKVAQGHVWLGNDALDKKLVDQIGGLYDAITYAKKKAGIGKRYKLVYYSVPGGESVQDVITASVVKYLEGNVLKLNDLDGTEDNLEIKY